MSRARSHRATGADEHAAVAVEFALVLPILLLLVFGIIDFSRLLQAQIALTQAVREAVRPVALNLQDWMELADERFYANVNTSSVDWADWTPVTSCEGDETDAVVEGAAGVTFVTPIGGFVDGLMNDETFTLNGRAEMRCGG